MSEDGDVETWYYYKECPLAHECSKSAFAKVDADTSLENLQAKLSQHLRCSGLHKESMQEIDSELLRSMIDSMEVHEHKEREWKHDAYPEPKRPKRTLGKGGGGVPNSAVITTSYNGSGSANASDMAVYHKVGPGKGGGKVSVRTTQLQAAVDCVARASLAASHAQRLAAQAAAAFGEEHATLNDVKDKLLAVLHSG